MYTKGLQIGDNSYLLNDEYELVLATINGTLEQMEEYIQMVNEYDDKLEEKSYFTDRLSEVHERDKKARITNIAMFITTIGSEVFTLTLSLMSGAFPTALFVLTPTIPVICFGTGAISNFASYGTKKKRKKEREKLSNKISKIKEELKELENKIDTLKNQMQYSETKIYEDEIIPVTTVDNKKSNVKMRVLKLDQSR